MSAASAPAASSGSCAAVAALHQQKERAGSSPGAGKSLPQLWARMQRLELASSFLSRGEEFHEL